MKKILVFILVLLISSSSFAELFIPKENKYYFEIIRKEKVIGFHEILFEKDNELIKIEINVDIKVKLGFITLFKYRHQNTEKWKNNELIYIKTNSTTNSKKEYSLVGEQKEDFFEYNGIDGIKNTDKDIIPISYWNKEIINKQEFLDSQKGIIRKIEVITIKEETLSFNNIEYITKKYEINVKSKHPTDEKELSIIYVWYTEEDELIKIEFKSPEDNSIITYKRII